jgi:hypothetical protein
MEFIAYGGVLAKDILLPVSFQEAIFLPVRRIQEMSQASMEWSLLSPNPALYAVERDMVAKIRKSLPLLAYADDGAVDRDGRAVFIATGLPQEKGRYGLNCSGFAKWIVDGIYAATGEEPEGEAPALSDIAVLKERDIGNRGSSFTQAYEESRDVFFGLDWVRSLAHELMGRLYPGMEFSRDDMDVRISPFAETTVSDDLLNHRLPFDLYPDFKPDAGYQARGLKALLYVLACRDPGAFYLGSRSYPQGEDPVLRQHSHIQAFFPYFGSDGIFKIAVFESAAETGIDAILKRGEEFFTFLVRLPSDSRYAPDLAMWRKE